MALLNLLGHKLVITSVHVTGPGVFDVLYQMPLSQVSEYRQVRSLLETLARDPRYRLSTRLYEDQEFNVLTEQRTEHSITVLNYRNHLLISTNANLIEAVVRRLAHPDAPTVQAAFPATDLLRVPGTDATLLVNYRRLPLFLDVLFRPDAHGAVDQLAGLVSQGLLSVKLEGSRAQLPGFSNPETARGTLQQRMHGQPAQPLTMSTVLSTRTAMLLHLAANPARTWPFRPGSDSLGRRAALDSPARHFRPRNGHCLPDGCLAGQPAGTAGAGAQPGAGPHGPVAGPPAPHRWQLAGLHQGRGLRDSSRQLCRPRSTGAAAGRRPAPPGRSHRAGPRQRPGRWLPGAGRRADFERLPPPMWWPAAPGPVRRPRYRFCAKRCPAPA